MKTLSSAGIALAALLAAIGSGRGQSIDEPISTPESNAIRSTIMQQRAEPPAGIHYKFSPGNVAPRNVTLQPLPPDVVRAHPAWRGHMYFLAGDQIVIVEPTTLRIVSILPA